MNTAEEKILLQETDSASGNLKLFNHFLTLGAQDQILRELMVCQSHQLHLVETAMVGTTNTKLISSFFSFTHFVRASNHWSKLKHAVHQLVRAQTDIYVVKSQEAPCWPTHAQYLDELTAMQLQVKKAMNHAYVQQKGEGSSNAEPNLSKFERKLQDFKQMWNTSLPSRSGKFVHQCLRSGPSETWCCKSDEEAREKMFSTLADVALSMMPETPAPGKWTKLWSCLQFMTFGVACSSFLPRVVETWLGELQFTRSKVKEPDPDLDPALTAVQEFQKIAGKRGQRTKEFLSTVEETILGQQLIVLNILEEVVRFLTFEFFSFSDCAIDKPTLCLLCNPETSPTVAAEQYLCSLLMNDDSEPTRLVLVFAREGFNSIQEWEHARPEQARALRRMTLLASCWIQRRHSDRFSEFPFCLSMLVNNQVSHERRQAVASRWDGKLRCCLRPGFARKLKDRGLRGADLLTPKRPAFHLPDVFCKYFSLYKY